MNTSVEAASPAAAVPGHRFDGRPSLPTLIPLRVLLAGGIGYTIFSLSSDMGDLDGKTVSYISFFLLGVALLIALGFELVIGFHRRNDGGERLRPAVGDGPQSVRALRTDSADGHCVVGQPVVAVHPDLPGPDRRGARKQPAARPLAKRANSRRPQASPGVRRLSAFCPGNTRQGALSCSSEGSR